MSLAILSRSIQLGNLSANLLVHTRLKLWAVAQDKEDLEPDKHRGEEERLEESVEERRGASLKGTMANELGNPGQDVDTHSDLQGLFGVLQAHVAREGSAADAKRGKDEACDGLEQQIKYSIGDCNDGAEVEIKIRN